MARLYAVTISRGSSHAQWTKLYPNLSEMNAKTLDYTSSWGICAIKHHIDADSVHERLTRNLKDPSSVIVEEITRESLDDQHVLYQDIYDRLYAPHDRFPNIE